MSPSPFINSIKNYKISKDNNEFNYSKPLDINKIINSLKENYDEKKQTNISLINNSVILNYMNEVRNNISVNNSGKKDDIKSSYTSV